MSSFIDRLLGREPEAEQQLEEVILKKEQAFSVTMDSDDSVVKIKFNPPFNTKPVITAHWETNEMVSSPTPLRMVGKIIPMPFRFPSIPPVGASILPLLKVPLLAEIDFKEVVPPIGFDIPQMAFDIPVDFIDVEGELSKLFSEISWNIQLAITKTMVGIDQKIFPTNLILAPVVYPLHYLSRDFGETINELLFRIISPSKSKSFTYNLGDRGTVTVEGPGLVPKVVIQLARSITDIQNRLTDVFEASVKQTGEYIQLGQQQIYAKINETIDRLNTVSDRLNNTVNGINQQMVEIEKTINQSLGRMNSMNDSLIGAVNNLSAGFNALSDATNEENAQVGEFINENLLVLQEFVYNVQGIRDHGILSSVVSEVTGETFGSNDKPKPKMNNDIEKLVPGLKRTEETVRSPDRVFRKFFPPPSSPSHSIRLRYGKQQPQSQPQSQSQSQPRSSTFSLRKKLGKFAVPLPDPGDGSGNVYVPPPPPPTTTEPTPPPTAIEPPPDDKSDMISVDLAPVDDDSGDIYNAPTTVDRVEQEEILEIVAENPDRYELQVIDGRSVLKPISKPSEKVVLVEQPPVVTTPPPSEVASHVVTAPIEVKAEGGVTEMYERQSIQVPAVKITAVTNSSFKIINPGRGAILHLTAREPTDITSSQVQPQVQPQP